MCQARKKHCYTAQRSTGGNNEKKYYRTVVGSPGTSHAFAQGTSEAKPVELVYTMTAVPTDAHAGAMRVFKETVERVSDGQIKVLTYDSASLFKQEQEVSAVKSGQADMTATAASCLPMEALG